MERECDNLIEHRKKRGDSRQHRLKRNFNQIVCAGEMPNDYLRRHFHCYEGDLRSLPLQPRHQVEEVDHLSKSQSDDPVVWVRSARVPSYGQCCDKLGRCSLYGAIAIERTYILQQ
jgi:hypothetical protein